MFDDIPRPTCRSVYTVSDKHLRHGGSGYETRSGHHARLHRKTSRVEFDELPASIPWIVFDKASRAVVKLFPHQVCS